MNVPLQKILLATDGSEDAALAIRASVDLSIESGAELHVVHALWHGAPTARFRRRERVGLEQQARGVLGRARERIEEAGGTLTEAHSKRGRAVDAILETADHIGADLIVVGSKGRGAIKRAALGSVSEGIVRRATRPVLMVRGGEEAWPPARVVVGDVDSKEAREAGNLAAAVAGCSEASMVLVRVYPRLLVRRQHGERSFLIGPSIEDALRKDEEVLGERAECLGEIAGERPQVRLLTGDAASRLLEMEQEEEGSTLFAIGSRTLGGVSTRILRASRGPVLIVPVLRDSPADPAETLDGEVEVPNYSTFLVATDGSKASMSAGEHAVSLARALGARLVVLSVVEADRAFRAGIYYGDGARGLAQDCREATRKIRDLATEAGVECEEMVLEGRPDRTIIAVAEEVGADCLILGSGGASRPVRALLGSASEKVLRHAGRPVLVVGASSTSVGTPHYGKVLEVR